MIRLLPLSDLRRPLTVVATGLLLVVCLSSSPVRAGTDTTTFNVNVNVISGCALSTTPDLSFGNYVPGGAALTGTTTISVTCTNGTNYVLALDYGTHAAGTQRKLYYNFLTLNYNLYTDVGHANLWMDATTCGTPGGSSLNCKYGTGNAAVQTYTVYGQLPGAQYPGGTGTFTDTITITVTY